MSLVIVVVVVDTIDEAIKLANASEYSLSASLWTGDVYAAQRTASRIRAGQHFTQSIPSLLTTCLSEGVTNINGWTIHSEPTDGLLGLGYALTLISFVILTHPFNTEEHRDMVVSILRTLRINVLL